MRDLLGLIVWESFLKLEVYMGLALRGVVCDFFRNWVICHSSLRTTQSTTLSEGADGELGVPGRPNREIGVLYSIDINDLSMEAGHNCCTLNTQHCTGISTKAVGGVGPHILHVPCLLTHLNDFIKCAMTLNDEP